MEKNSFFRQRKSIHRILIPRKADNRVKWRTDLMADIGDKRAFHLVGVFRYLFGCTKLTLGLY